MTAFPAEALIVVALGYLAGGFVKGAIGFALPTVALVISATVLPPQIAVACLALPTLLTNTWQSGRDGAAEGLATLRRFRVLIGVLLASLLAGTQLLPVLSERLLSGIVGAGILLFALAQLSGWKPSAPPRPLTDIVVGGIAGLFGGIAGIWGPPILLFLLALDVSKRELVRAAGISFLLGSFPFLIGHLHTGLLNALTLSLSAAMCIPVTLGMWLGQKLQDRLNAAALRRAILAVLVLAGLRFLLVAVMA